MPFSSLQIILKLSFLFRKVYNMKKIINRLSLTLAGLTMGLAATAVPACPTPVKVMQPDGSYVTLRLVGDEFNNMTVSLDGYALVHNETSGAWEYAIKGADGSFSASNVAAHDLALRTPGETAFVSANLEKAQLGTETSTPVQKSMKADMLRMTAPAKAPLFDYSKFKGLIILVEYSDVKFSRADYARIAEEMANKENYDGYMSNGEIPEKVECTGSVKDYFKYSSMGKFAPHFDVVGPVGINYASTYPRQTTNAQTVIKAALAAADDQINYKDYDADGDGTVDMFYVIFAGAGSNFGSNNQNLLWPHAWQVQSYSLDGVAFGRYACSTELYGSPSNKKLDGVGVICHEFSHVLGLPDLYDTNYATGGQSIHPGDWSVMAQGPYLNESKTPCAYTFFERMYAGFVEPQILDKSGDYKIESLNLSNQGYRINTVYDKEYFLLENRQQEVWNKYLPGHGLMIYRVDESDPNVWTNNTINANSSHNYFELLRANPKKTGTSSVEDSAGDPFPGSDNITEINDKTTPALKAWVGFPANVFLSDIKEDAKGVISFKAIKQEAPTLFEDFEKCSVLDKTDVSFEGKFTTWTVAKGAIVTDVDATSGANGKTLKAEGAKNRVVSMVNKSKLTTGVIDKKVNCVSFKVHNTSSSTAGIRLEYSVNNGLVFSPLNDAAGTATILLPGNASQPQTLTFPLAGNKTIENAMFRVSQQLGSSSMPIHVDDFSFSYEPTSGIGDISVESKTEGLKITTDGLNLNIEGADASAPVEIYNISGVKVAGVSGVSSASFTLGAKGVYVVANGYGRTHKIIL